MDTKVFNSNSKSKLEIQNGRCKAKLYTISNSKNKHIIFDTKSYREGSGIGVVTLKESKGRYDTQSISQAVICRLKNPNGDQQENTVLFVSCDERLREFIESKKTICALFPQVQKSKINKGFVEIELTDFSSSLGKFAIGGNHGKANAEIIALTLQLDKIAGKNLKGDPFSKHLTLAKLKKFQNEGTKTLIFGYTERTDVCGSKFTVRFGHPRITGLTDLDGCRCDESCLLAEEKDSKLRSFNQRNESAYKLLKGGFILNYSDHSPRSVYGLYVENSIICTFLHSIIGKTFKHCSIILIFRFYLRDMWQSMPPSTFFYFSNFGQLSKEHVQLRLGVQKSYLF